MVLGRLKLLLMVSLENLGFKSDFLVLDYLIIGLYGLISDLVANFS